jgi:hypothetical protein
VRQKGGSSTVGYTKFIGRHRGGLTELLDLQPTPNRIDITAPDFEGRYGFARKPDYVRFRTASGHHGYTELAVRADELSAPPPGITRAYVIENEITYLAFPLPPDAVRDPESAPPPFPQCPLAAHGQRHPAGPPDSVGYRTDPDGSGGRI